MKHMAWFLAVVAVSFGCGRSMNVDQERNALLNADREWSQQSIKDLDKFVSYYAADASLYPAGMPIATGTGAIRTTLGQITALPGIQLHWTPSKADVGASGDLGYTTGTYELTVNDVAGRPTTEKGKYVEVWRRQSDGKWKVVADIFNADAPPAVAQPK